MNRHISKTTAKRLFAEFAGLCAIPNCTFSTRLGDGTPILQVAHINSITTGGPRFDPDETPEDLNGYDNLILVCPAHHELIDKEPERYTTGRLRFIRQAHIGRVAAILASPTKSIQGPSQANILRQGLNIWESHRSNSTEEFWHELFASRPELLSPALNGRAYTINSKCFVGGKSLGNTGGNILDFLIQHQSNAVLIEIKTPNAKLIGRQYRGNVWPPSRELVGACVQVLEYRASLLNHIHTLRDQSPDLTAPAPTGVIILGDMESSCLSTGERRSFELFRTSLKDVTVITYDELFERVEFLATLLDVSGE
ncbi:Shedu anti-phage system protein SduA domain-containing protein [Actinopolymorpha pittospori]